MNILLLIIPVISLLTGVLTWFIAKGSSRARIASLETTVDKTQQEADAANKRYDALQHELNTALQAKAGIAKEVELLSATLAEHKQQIAIKENAYADQQQQLFAIKEENATLEATYKATLQRLEEQQKFVTDAQKNLKDAFGALSADALQHNNTSFVELAKAKLEEKVTEAKGALEKKEQAIGELVKPLSESLKNMDTKIQDLEGRRIKAYSDIWNYLDQMKVTTEGLKKETNNLVGALKTSHTRGRYGELALRRLVEHAGMMEHCDFEEQVTVADESGKLRPDMIIQLPGDKKLVVDSKAPLAAYLRMFETDDAEQQKLLLSQHVIAVKEHLKQLSAKAYWSQFDEAPDFVIMYIHIESSYAAALQAWPDMIEEAMKNRIIIATPTVLLSILLGIGYSWNQLKTMENIEAIRNAAVELHDRSAVLIDHIVSLGRSLNGTVAHYNKAIGSLESSFLPQARKINTLSQAYVKKQLPEILPIEIAVRPVTVDTREISDASVAVDTDI